MEEILGLQMIYEGRKQPRVGERDPITGELLYPYLPSSELIEAVNLTILLERPLFLKGEPGCGKTRLARAVAYELGLPFERWTIKSTSRARDGLYVYDAVGRLRDAQLAQLDRLTPEQIKKLDDPETYIRWGPLGNAFRNQQKTVVLIDEIDKADIDFPNDLLQELEEGWFKIDETGQEIRATAKPIMFITSNDEKDLPDAFLRRCLFHYVEFPTRSRLIDIIKAHFPQSPEDLLIDVLDRFLELREEMKKDKGETGKKVSTSELMDWIRVLSYYPQDQILAQLKQDLLFPGVLLKSWEDYRVYPQRMKSKDEFS